jgi:hypothetical protein
MKEKRKWSFHDAENWPSLSECLKEKEDNLVAFSKYASNVIQDHGY